MFVHLYNAVCHLRRETPFMCHDDMLLSRRAHPRLGLSQVSTDGSLTVWAFRKLSFGIFGIRTMALGFGLKFYTTKPSGVMWLNIERDESSYRNLRNW